MGEILKNDYDRILENLPNCHTRQGHSQNYTKGVLNSPGLCSVETQIHSLAKHLATKENVHHPVYDHSGYTVTMKSFASYMCTVAY